MACFVSKRSKYLEPGRTLNILKLARVDALNTTNTKGPEAARFTLRVVSVVYAYFAS